MTADSCEDPGLGVVSVLEEKLPSVAWSMLTCPKPLINQYEKAHRKCGLASLRGVNCQ
jgi:hypothetical protein